MGIDPSALSYTEQKVVNRVLESLETFRRHHPDALWVPARFPHWTPNVSADIFGNHE